MVTDVSAMFVDTMHFLTPSGAMSNTLGKKNKHQYVTFFFSKLIQAKLFDKGIHFITVIDVRQSLSKTSRSVDPFCQTTD